MSILVTGGAGFIGSYICKVLLEQGREVVCVDDFNDYYDPGLKELRIKDFVKDSHFFLHRADITNLSAMKKIFEQHRIDVMVHLAARAGVRASIEQPLLYQSVNVQGTLNLLELSKEAENFVFASSSSVYGGNTKVPFSEGDPVDKPISPYAATKRAGELLCHTYHHLFTIPMTCLRFFTVYGEMGRPDMALFKFTKAIVEGRPLTRYGDGSSQRDYTYVADVVAGIMAAIKKPHEYEIINLGNSKPVKLNYFISLIEKEVGKKAMIDELPMPPGDVPLTFADISKAKRLLDYKPQVSIEEGVKSFVQWYKEYAALLKKSVD